jgi:hypothetical protein
MTRGRICKAVVCGALLVLATMASPPPARAESTGDVNFILGTKQLDKNDWQPVESQGEFGVEVTWGGSHWPIRIATDYLASTREDNLPGTGLRVQGTTWEWAFGVRKVWENKAVRPYVGGGLMMAAAQSEVKTIGKEDDFGFGAWVGGGVFWRLGTRFNIGVAGRISGAKVDLGSATGVQAGGSHLGLILGWGWPATH